MLLYCCSFLTQALRQQVLHTLMGSPSPNHHFPAYFNTPNIERRTNMPSPWNTALEEILSDESSFYGQSSEENDITSD
jgi:hypothetical protein